MSERKEFREVEIGEAFDPSFGMIIEKSMDSFPERPFGVFMKVSETEGVWLRTGQKREFMQKTLVKVEEIKITRA